MVEHGCVDGLSIVNAITNEAIDFLIDLIQQLRHLRRVLLVAFRDRGGDNLPLTIGTDTSGCEFCQSA
jgi:hypothetical protein